MSNNVQLIANAYNNSVMTWGNQKPWKKLGLRLSHKVSFQPDAVVRDGFGNILSMPTLTRKPCFGRPEAFYRHGQRIRKLELKNGRIVDSTNHQCGSCPEGVHKACSETAHERVESNPTMRRALQEWEDYCDTHHNGTPTFIGPASHLWGAFKRAIAARGPFDSSNDAAIAEQEREIQDVQRQNWKNQKRHQRHRERQRAKETHKLPSEQFMLNLVDARDYRRDALLEVLGQSGQPPTRAKVPAEKREATAIITANAWAVRAVLQASGQNARPGSVARLMVKHNLSAGVSAPTLKARMKNDLKRADECTRDGLWKPFDPDSDLESYETIDDDAADELSDPVNEIDDILRQMDETYLF